jgi:hypothetical protein
MGWKDKALKILKERFGNNSFHAVEAVDLLEQEADYRPGTTYRLLKDLADSGKLMRIGYGIYNIGEHKGIWMRVTSPSLALSMERARGLLLDRGVEFMITGPPVLVGYMHSLPRRMIHLIYTLKGSGEYVAEVLGAEYEVLVNPSEEEVNVALSISDRDLVVVREFSNLPGGKDGVASIERALVDLYFESTRRRIPFPVAEAGRIIFSALRNARIDLAKLNKSASRRGIDGELRALIKAAGIHVPDTMTKNVKMNGYVESILSTIGRGV